MKKLSLILVLVLLFSTVCGIAEGIDFSSMSDEEVNETYSKILDEMRTRGIVRNGVLGAGIYTIGVDVAPGSYNFSSVEENYAYYYVFDSQEVYTRYKELQEDVNFILSVKVLNKEKAPVKVDLEEGNILYVQSNAINLEEPHSLLTP